MTVQKYAIRIREKKPRDFLCPALNCDKVCHMVKELNGHIASTHPDFKYRCSMCPKHTVLTMLVTSTNIHITNFLTHAISAGKGFFFPVSETVMKDNTQERTYFLHLEILQSQAKFKGCIYVSMWKHTQRFVTLALTKNVNKRLTLFQFLNNMKREATVMAIFLCVGQV